MAKLCNRTLYGIFFHLLLWFAGHEFLCWFVTIVDAWGKCILVGQHCQSLHKFCLGVVRIILWLLQMILQSSVIRNAMLMKIDSASVLLILSFLVYRRTLTGIIDDYFDGYYSEEMVESQVMFFSLFCFTWFPISLRYFPEAWVSHTAG